MSPGFSRATGGLRPGDRRPTAERVAHWWRQSMVRATPLLGRMDHNGWGLKALFASYVFVYFYGQKTGVHSINGVRTDLYQRC